MSYSRREVLRMAGAGSAALWLGGCGGSENTAKPVAGRRVEAVRRHDAELHLREHGADLRDRREPRRRSRSSPGSRSRSPSSSWPAMVQKVALDFASGEGAYQIVYADPYQVMAPYNQALADLNEFQEDPDLPHARRPSTTSSRAPARRLRALRRRRASSTRCPTTRPTMIWMYRKDLFEKHGDQMKQDLGFDPNAARRLDLGRVLQDLRSGSRRTPTRRTSPTATATRPSSTTR